MRFLRFLTANLLLCAAADREVQRILLELLNQMDGFDQNVNVKVTFGFIQFDLLDCSDGRLPAVAQS